MSPRPAAGAARGTAMRAAQRAVRGHHPHPYLWGGFVQHGDPGPLRTTTMALLPGPDPEDRMVLGYETSKDGHHAEAGAWLAPRCRRR